MHWCAFSHVYNLITYDVQDSVKGLTGQASEASASATASGQTKTAYERSKDGAANAYAYASDAAEHVAHQAEAAQRSVGDKTSSGKVSRAAAQMSRLHAEIQPQILIMLCQQPCMSWHSVCSTLACMLWRQTM